MKSILVLLSSYNGERFIIEQLESLLKQTNVNLHILIRDDGSTDKTLKLVKLFMAEKNNITLLEGQNIGFSASFHELTKYALFHFRDYSYFSFSDQDDVWLSDKLFQGITKIEKRSNFSDVPILYCSNLILVDEYLNELGLMKSDGSFSKYSVFVDNVATGCTCVFNRKTLSMFVESFRKDLILHDYWMFCLCIYLGVVIYDKIPYVLYRQHSSNVLGGKKNKWTTWCIHFKSVLFGKSRNIESSMAKHLLDLYQYSLSVDDFRIIEKIANYRVSWRNKCDLIFDTHYMNVDSKLLDFVNFRLRILINRL